MIFVTCMTYGECDTQAMACVTLRYELTGDGRNLKSPGEKNELSPREDLSIRAPKVL
jgi:hypothetical protein